MSASVRTITDYRDANRGDNPNVPPFFHTFPVWVIDALHAKGFRASDAVSIKVMPKTAEVEFPSAVSDTGAATLKIRRTDAFPDRS